MAHEGKQFEKDWRDSCKKEDIFIMRIKDSPAWGKDKQQIPVSRNPCDFIMYSKPELFLLELKSTKGTSFSFDEKIIKKNQLKKLKEASKTDGVVTGLVFNFRPIPNKRDNSTYFVSINNFLGFKKTCKKHSLNEQDCRDIGFKIINTKLKVHYHYNVTDFVHLIKRLDIINDKEIINKPNQR